MSKCEFSHLDIARRSVAQAELLSGPQEHGIADLDGHLEPIGQDVRNTNLLTCTDVIQLDLGDEEILVT